MTVVLQAGEPLEALRVPVGRESALLVDTARNDRGLGVDCWYPAVATDDPASVYEVLPGVGFTASARAGAPLAPGSHPLLVFSHGRLGNRTSYAMLCEGLAARGYVVVAPDHPGDTLGDWLLSAAVDDATNERQRVADARFVLDAVLEGRAGLAGTARIDPARVALAGHSYGGFTSFAYAGGEPRDPRLAAVAGLQAFTRTIPAPVLGRIEIPALLIAAAHDESCPPDSDCTPAFAALTNGKSRRVDIAQAGHQGCSDVGLYLELQPHVADLPEFVVAFLGGLAEQVTGRAGDPWRPTVGLHLRILGAWLDDVLDRDAARAGPELAAIFGLPGVTTQSAPTT